VRKTVGKNSGLLVVTRGIFRPIQVQNLDVVVKGGGLIDYYSSITSAVKTRRIVTAFHLFALLPPPPAPEPLDLALDDEEEEEEEDEETCA